MVAVALLVRLAIIRAVTANTGEMMEVMDGIDGMAAMDKTSLVRGRNGEMRYGTRTWNTVVTFQLDG